ncbi:MAG: DUF58 domain-containing protein [Desulfobacterales bacterium]
MKFVPTIRLIILTGFVLLPVSVLAAMMPWTSGAGIGMAALLVLIAAADAAVSRKRLAGIRVTLPGVVRLSVGRNGRMTLSIENPDITLRQLRIGLAFPRELYSPYPEMRADLPAGGLNSLVDWPFKGLKQGLYRLDNCYLEASSRLGFWALRRADAAHTEIRVYPDLLREPKTLSALFLNRGIGFHARRQVGKGKEFEQLREYLPGDSYEDIHWKATARRSQPITKVYQLERTQQIYVIIDCSRLSARNSEQPDNNYLTATPGNYAGYTTIMERFTTAALLMGLAADRQGDAFGLLAFDDRVRKFVRAKNGRAHYDVCRDALYTLRAQSVSPDFSEVFTFIASRIRRRALLIFLTNLDDPVLSEAFISNIDIISRKHLVLVNMFKPVGSEPLFTDPNINSVDEIYQKLGGHLVWRHLRETERFLQRHGIGFYLLQNENLCADMLSQYLTVKKRQVL